MTLLLVVAGAMLGAPARYLVDRAVQARHGTGFPWGTFAVNVSGSFLLGLVVMLVPESLIALFGTGFCGAFTTYSTFAYETHQLSRGKATLNVVASVGAGLCALYLGLSLARALT